MSIDLLISRFAPNTGIPVVPENKNVRALVIHPPPDRRSSWQCDSVCGRQSIDIHACFLNELVFVDQFPENGARVNVGIFDWQLRTSWSTARNHPTKVETVRFRWYTKG